MCTFLFWVVHCGIWVRCILRFVRLVYFSFMDMTDLESSISMYILFSNVALFLVRKCLVSFSPLFKSINTSFCYMNQQINYRVFLVNTLRLRKYGLHFADDGFKVHFLLQKLLYFNSNFTQVCSKGPINKMPALVQRIAWCWIAHKSLFEPMIASFTDAYICPSA